MATSVKCHRCKSQGTWRKSEWCIKCIYDVCCKNYPKQHPIHGWVTCVHGNKVKRELGIQ